MCTKPRLIVPQVIYEVTSRGVFGADIFPTPELKSFFLKELHCSLLKFSYQCYGWSLMKDHYHLVLKSSIIPISKVMQRLNSVYAKKFNKECGRKGVVFYRRFASVIIQEDTCLDSVVRYVHLNPVRCGECTIEELEGYEWSGHAAGLLQYSGTPGDCHKTCNDEKILLENLRNANRGLQKFSKPHLWVIGDQSFTAMVLKKDKSRRARLARYQLEGVTHEVLHMKVGQCMNLRREDLFRQGRRNARSTARELFAFIGTSRFDFSCTSLALYLGITGSAVSRMISRCNSSSNKNPLVDKICKEF